MPRKYHTPLRRDGIKFIFNWSVMKWMKKVISRHQSDSPRRPPSLFRRFCLFRRRKTDYKKSYLIFQGFAPECRDGFHFPNGIHCYGAKCFLSLNFLPAARPRPPGTSRKAWDFWLFPKRKPRNAKFNFLRTLRLLLGRRHHLVTPN